MDREQTRQWLRENLATDPATYLIQELDDVACAIRERERRAAEKAEADVERLRESDRRRAIDRDALLEARDALRDELDQARVYEAAVLERAGKAEARGQELEEERDEMRAWAERAVAERDNMITREAAANRAVSGMRAEASEFEAALYSAAEAAGVSVDILTAEIARLREAESERDAMRAVIEHARWWRDHPGAPGRKLIDALNRLDALDRP